MRESRLRWDSNARKRAAREQLEESRRAVMLRSGGYCEATVSDYCAGAASQAHHIKRRSQGGTHDADNLLAVCTACHDWIHLHPAESYERGFLKRSGD